MITGSCLCGEVAWQISGALELMSHCHCSMCRKSHGAAFGTYAGAKAEVFRWLRGEDRIVRYESSPGFERPFCSRCGSVVAGDPHDGQVFMPVGCLDGDPGARPLAHIFVASRAPWHAIADDLPRFDAYPPGYGAPELGDDSRRRSEPGIARGSCLCGAVRFEAEGEAPAIVDCHCSRCRKARSAAHGSNLIAPRAGFRWISGESQLREFRVAEAKRYGNRFCATCGSSLPRELVESDRVAIPAGTLDGDPGGRERIHIFVGSKAPWYEIADDLPQFDEYPPGAS